MQTVEKEKYALITGGSRGLGFALANSLNQAGYRLWLAARSLDGLLQATNRLKTKHPPMLSAGDLTNQNNLQNLLLSLEEHNILPSIVIHNLGGKAAGDKSPLNITALRRSMQLNLEVAVAINAHLLPKMSEIKHGRVIHISSNASITGDCAPGYAAAKAALNAYVKSTARYYIKDNVMLCAILPGILGHTDSIWDKRKITHPQRYKEKIAEMPLGRFAKPEELSGTITDIACSDSMLCSGSLIELAGAF